MRVVGVVLGTCREARDLDDTLFALEHTMERIRIDTTPQEFLEELHRALLRHTGGRSTDDVAVILVERLPQDRR
ncbi:SpoIIE family protein phosphatase [Streptomyces sp. NPDC052079]|uniref:SpoIIE family protein phosphatase n=1 Tax=Streptomyces sp. NPDC052079 TaxID=3155526 RepID=UPI00343CFF6B